MTGIELAGLAALISAVGNIALGIWGIFKKKDLDAVSEGMVIIEEAIDANKDTLRKYKPGRAVTKTIKDYGPAARATVDTARRISHAIAKERYEKAIIRREHEKRAELEAQRARESS